MWSICAYKSTIDLNAVSRIARAGCDSGNCWNCVRISGDVLNNSQSTSLLLTAIEDWVRRFALIVPLRTPSQLGQLQFHCGNPPPAAEPRTLTLIRITLFFCLCYSIRKAPETGAFLHIHSKQKLSVCDVHGDFETETHFGILRLCPHVKYLQKSFKTDQLSTFKLLPGHHVATVSLLTE